MYTNPIAVGALIDAGAIRTLEQVGGTGLGCACAYRLV